MFSYRHGFHAGNHADVLKHAMLVALLRYMARKDKAYWYVDTHAGAGAYALTEGFAAKREEFNNGVGRLWPQSAHAQHKAIVAPASAVATPALIVDYLDQIAAMNPDGQLQFYPGSPYLAWQLLRDQDRMRLFELHPSEIDILADNFARTDKRTLITKANGFDALRGVMPPASRRALTLIDPSYEDKQDYARTLASVADAMKRFATGVYAVWYPIVSRAESAAFPAQLRNLGATSWLHATLQIATPSADGFGLHGSGMFVINPPFVLEGLLQEALPWLCDALAEDDGATWSLEAYIP
ncbi:23S rRNA (adenine(2030)-N(6))-methyltransferase RlmJ [Robbsia sp. KACC 23696]|uniref:23S rRNA (adenine(2030)-N(6))-methyltransferase RlmJ n=1 Tax=Robbsia sp. KACC 23696 TaxID=3149231 RepID=UPI00325AA58A